GCPSLRRGSSLRNSALGAIVSPASFDKSGRREDLDSRGPRFTSVPDIIGRVGERHVVFLLALQHAAVAQQPIQPAQHLRIAPQGAAIIAHRFTAEYDIE